MKLEFSGDIWYWKGPAPWYFVTVPPAEAQAIQDVAKIVTYGWGVIPVTVVIGQTEFKTSLFPKEGAYLVPLKAAVRHAERLEEGDTVTIRLSITL